MRWKLPKRSVACGVGCVLLGCGVACAQQATLVGDAHVSSAQPTVNSGSLSNLNVGGGYTALLQFDLGMLPAGVTASQITRATLRVYCNRADTPGLVSLQAVNGAWKESSVTYATLPPLGVVLQSASVGTVGQFVTFDVTSAVQGWVTAPAANNGLALSAASAMVQIDSKENDQTAHEPQLEIALAAGGSAVGGATGVTGATGPVGATGAAGLNGSNGATGAVGATGIAGVAGATGATGAAGSMGAMGATGVGLVGATGATGLQGSTGVGTAGVTGLAGATGSVGATGATGLPGMVYQGSYSSATNYALGDVVLFAGSSYASLTASNHGNTPGVNVGAWGLLTAQGAVGLQGMVGATGATGVQGLPGSVGPPGEQGPQGLQGIAGQAGAQGLAGPVGATGVQGPVGPQGVAGATGLSFQGAYSSATNYGLGDGVFWQGAGWVSLVASNHGNTPDQSPLAWAMFASSGSAGPTGATGLAGGDGSPGVMGTTGAAGVDGATGVTGSTGVAGLAYQGAYSSAANYAFGDVVVFGGSSYASLTASNHGNTPGLSPDEWGLLAAVGGVGPQGVVGGTGSIGVTGPQGVQGVQGVAGPQGPTGMQGPAGAQGIAGTNGVQGAQGPMGPQGVPGQAGAQGIAGTDGATGPAGAVGPMGATGVAGASGAAGATGATGSAGMAFQGDYAAVTNYALGDVVQFGGASYGSLMDGNHGNTPGASPAAWGLLAAMGTTGPQGPAGATGNAGLTGPQGVQGMPGVAGVQGPMGPEGPVGAQGVAGANGVQGAQGPIGLQGIAGQAGAQGVAGMNGATGSTGPSGAQGSSGATGSTGSAGTTGATGPVGMNFRGVWSSATHYAVNDAVTYGGSSYLAESAGINLEPDLFPSAWQVIAQAGGAGPTGAAGTSATVSVGTVTTLAAGAAATVTNAGTPQAAVLNFGIPQGVAGAAGTGGSSTGGNVYAAMYHTVSYATTYYAVNAPTASTSEGSGSVLAWVPQACTATRLDVYSQQSGAVKVTLRNGATPGTMADTSLNCTPSTSGSCPALGSVVIAAGSFIDFRFDYASGTPAGVWTSLQCQ